MKFLKLLGTAFIVIFIIWPLVALCQRSGYEMCDEDPDE